MISIIRICSVRYRSAKYNHNLAGIHIGIYQTKQSRALLEINGITLIKKWYNPVASWYTIYGITKKNKCYTI